MTGSMGRRAVKVGYADGDRLGAAFKVGSHRRRKNTELIFLGRLYADDRVASEHEGTDIKGRSGTERGNLVGVGGYGLGNGVDKALLGELGHFQPCGGIHHTLRVQIRAEGDDVPVLRRVSL